MAKILFIGDPHLKITEFQRSIEVLRWIESVAQEVKPDLVFNLGDTFHTHATLRSELLKEFYNHVHIIAAECPYYYVLGNHDQFKPKDAKYHALQTINIPNFKLFDYTVLEESFKDATLTIVPYVNNYESFPTTTSKIVITHNTFIGADYGFKIENMGIDADKVSADIIISGHIHKQQTFGKVVYPGTPYASSSSDIDEEKGLLLFDTNTYEKTFIKSRFPMWKSVKFTIDTSNSTQSFHNTLVASLDTLNKWVITATGPKTELTAYFDSSEYKDLVKDKSVTYRIVPTESNKLNKVQISASKDADIVTEWVNKVYSGTVDKQVLISKAVNILNNI